MTFSELLVQLGMETKIDLATAAQAGGCTIRFDEKLDITLESDPQTGAVQIYYVFDSPPERSLEDFYGAILQLHVFGLATDGGVFGIAPPSDRVLFFKTLPLRSLDAAEALRQVESFVNQAERWRDALPLAVAEIASPARSPINPGRPASLTPVAHGSACIVPARRQPERAFLPTHRSKSL